MRDWTLAPLGSIASVEMGQSPKGESVNRSGLGTPLLNGPTEFGRRHPTPVQWTAIAPRVARVGDILFCVRGSTTGRMNEADQPYAIGRGIAAIRGADPADSRYLQYALQHTLASLLAGVTGSTFPNLSRAQLLSHQIPVPPASMRGAIAEVLGALDEKITANEYAAGVADQLVEAAFVRALGRGGGSSRALFDEIDVDFGEPFSGSQFTAPGVGRPLVRIRDLKTAEPQVWTTERRVREVVVQPGDVVVGMDAEFRASLWLGQPGLLNQRVMRARGKRAGTGFVLSALQRPLAGLEAEKSATTVIHLNKSDLARATVDLPSPTALSEFEALAQPVIQLRVDLALETRTLTHTRDALMPLLLSGQVRAKVAERVLEGVL